MRSEKHLPPLDPKYDFRTGDYQRAITRKTPQATQATREVPLLDFHNRLNASQSIGGGLYKEASMLREAIKAQDERIQRERADAQM